ncbi:MAG TPA: zinc dependent phospholipase C family protein [Vicinamibacterales bacterium]|nr:zinc dependent phospholipase C family protein [Vicinamibacterales bacterium]
MRRFLIASLTALIACAPAPLRAWGFDVHRLIADRAIALLPAEIRPFYEKHRAMIVEHSIDPDLWRNVGFTEEPPRHYVDMDAYGRHPFAALPHDYDVAVKKYGEAFVIKNGTLPWRAAEIHEKLVKAFADAGRPDPGYGPDDVKFFSAVLAHYVADAHVPFHAALNYDGQLTGQWGIHSRFESQLVLRSLSRLRIDPRPVAPIKDAREFIFDSLTNGFPYVEQILAADRKAVKGRDEYDDEYFEKLLAATQPIVERQLAASISDVAALIAGAWEAAGRPALPLEPPRIPRKVRRR